MKKLSIDEPYTLLGNGTLLKNRLVKSAMSEGMASGDHLPNQELSRLYQAWAEGGTGLVITGNVMIDQKALGEPGNVVLENEDNLELFAQWAEAGTVNDTHLWMQINHPGKQVIKGVVKEGVAPSDVPFPPQLQRFFAPARALTETEIEALILKFAKTAFLAKKSGFTGVQIHAAHGYLISQFLSPRHNKREDQWGGSIENRFRFLAEIYKAIRKEVGRDFPIGVKINSADFMKAGFTEEESVFVIGELERLGMDLIEISGGTYEKAAMTGRMAAPSTLKREAYFLEYAEQLKKTTDVPIILTGGFRSRNGMDEALQSGATDFIGLARPLAVAPDYAASLLRREAPNVTIKPVKTGLPFIDKRGLMETVWYSQQLKRLGKGKRAKPHFPPLLSLIMTVLKNGKEVLGQKRV